MTKNNDRALILSYYHTVGRISATLAFDLYNSKEELKQLLKEILEDFQRAEGKERSIVDELKNWSEEND